MRRLVGDVAFYVAKELSKGMLGKSCSVSCEIAYGNFIIRKQDGRRS